MTRSCINLCLLAVISLLFGVIWLSPAVALAAPPIVPVGQISEGLRGPTMIDLDSDGNLYVADCRAHAVFKFDSYGTKVGVFSGAQVSGAGLAVAAGGRVYVSAGDAVAILDAAGTLTGYLGQGPGEFLFAGAIDFDVNGNIYVVDQTAGRIKVFGPDGLVGSVFPVQRFSGGIGLSIDPASNLVYIVNDNIDEAAGIVPTLYVYDTGGVLQNSIAASSGFGTALFDFGAVAFDDADYYYVSDFNQGTIRVMDVMTNAPLLNYGFGSVNHPGSMAFDADNSLLYVLYGDARVDIYAIDNGSIPVEINNPPSVPVPVTLGEVSSLTPGLIFNNSTDAESDTLTYDVQVLAGATQVTSFSVAEGVNQTTAIVDLSLDENASYTWQVRADDGQATSAWSSPQAFYVNVVEEAPSAPVLTSFLGGEDAGSDAILSWAGSSDADPNPSVNYRVEISEGASVVASSTYAALSAPITDLSAALTPGATYSWKVVAVDNTALETTSASSGSLVFQASVLRVSANVPGSSVYLSGHHGYAGRLVGTAPVEIRGLAEGSYALVVEAAGFEPYVMTVDIIKDAQTDVVAGLKGARLATSFAVHGLRLVGQAVQGVGVAPAVADLDRDGILDLLLADDGYINFYKGSLVLDPLAADTIEDLSVSKVETDRVVFATAPQQLEIPPIAGAAPCLVDWDNDDKLDLLVGGADGKVQLFSGQGGLSFSAVPQWLVTVNSQAVPVVGDVNGDGAKDLVVASGLELLLFANVGTDSAPSIGLETVMATLTAPAVPMFSDWSADGSRELMLLIEGELFRTEISGDVVTATTSTGLSVAGAERVFALNFAGSNYFDLVYGTNTGTLVVANGQQGGFAPAYKEALLTKLADVEPLVLDQAPELLSRLANIVKRIEGGKYGSALIKAGQLVDLLGADSFAGIAVAEFIGILQ